MTTQAHVRWMITRDMAAVLRIERASFAVPWSKEDFERTLRQANRIGHVAEVGDEVVGYVIYELHKSHVRILNFAVAPACRREGVGSCLVGRLVRNLESGNRRRIVAGVRESNLEAQLFFKSQSFRAVRVVRGFYEDCDEDAYVMEFRV